MQMAAITVMILTLTHTTSDEIYWFYVPEPPLLRPVSWSDPEVQIAFWDGLLQRITYSGSQSTVLAGELDFPFVWGNIIKP